MISPEESLALPLVDQLITETLRNKKVRDAASSPEAKKLFGMLPKIKGGGIGALLGLGAASGALSGSVARFMDNKFRKKPWYRFGKDDPMDGIGRAATRGLAEGLVATPLSVWLANMTNAARVNSATVNSLSKQFKVPFIVRQLNKVLGGSSALVGRSAVAAAAAAPFLAAHAIGRKLLPDKKRSSIPSWLMV
jgi:hypothetical protein